MADRIDAFASAVEMLAALRARKVSAVELLDVHRRRIERHNPALNAIVEPDFDRARRDADAADARRARGEEVPLLGLPMTLKESINVRGLRTTVGMPGSQDFRSEHDAPVTVRVKAADPLHRARRSGVGRLHPSVRLRRRRLSGWNARSGAAVRGRMTAESATRPRNIALPCCAR